MSLTALIPVQTKGCDSSRPTVEGRLRSPIGDWNFQRWSHRLATEHNGTKKPPLAYQKYVLLFLCNC